MTARLGISNHMWMRLLLYRFRLTFFLRKSAIGYAKVDMQRYHSPANLHVPDILFLQNFDSDFFIFGTEQDKDPEFAINPYIDFY